MLSGGGVVLDFWTSCDVLVHAHFHDNDHTVGVAIHHALVRLRSPAFCQVIHPLRGRRNEPVLAVGNLEVALEQTCGVE